NASILSFFMTILKPVALLLTWIGNQVTKLTKGDMEVSVTEEELYNIIEDMTKEGTLDEEQGELISSALQFQDVPVESIATSRVDLTALDVEYPKEKVLEIIKNTNHSRLPIYEGTIDKIIGTLQIRKYMKAYLLGENVEDLRKLMDKPFFIHQSAKIDDVLPSMSKEKSNIAIVTDNYGGTLGIVTVEDILEELVGEIWDEDDFKEETIIEIKKNLYSVDASDLVTDILDDLDIDYTEEEEEEVENKLMSEWVFENFTDIPKEGDSFDYLNTKISVQTMKDNRILRVKIEVFEDEEVEE
ncbi:MAG: CBS domain-containing protein, partial [Solobacterium sp.]|nr:CBS domain-containing protein [Solobacterium sp.]